MEIKTFKLITGEEVIAELHSENDDYVEILRPVALVETETGSVSLVPWLFSVDLETKTTKEVEKTIVDKETGKEEKVKAEEEVVTSEPVRIILKEPNRRQVEEADMEYSIEMSQCVKRGILTKAMLANKYTDTGGLVAEEDAKSLAKSYGKLGEIQSEYTRLSTKTGKKTKEDEERLAELLEDIAALRKHIVDTETAYASLFNHTADTKAQNRAIMWYVLNLTYVMREEDEEPQVFFKGETFEEKENHYFELDEKEDPLYLLIQGKIATFISYWYYASAITKEDFQKLDQDIENGDV